MKTRESGTVYSVDDAGDIQWAIDFLREHEPAVEGAGGDNHTYITFCILKEHGVGQDKALELALEYWNDRCSPPWDYDDLERKCESAYKSAQNGTGSKSAAAEFKVPIIQSAQATPAPGAPPADLRLSEDLDQFDETSIPYRDWVFGEMAIRGKLMEITAPGGSSKSTWTMTMALSKATGRNLLDIEPRGVGRVLLYNNEDDMEELKRRLIAQMGYFNITWADICDDDGRCRIRLSSGEKTLFQIARRDRHSNQLKPFHADLMVKELVEFRADLLIVDPLAETHPAQENSNDEMKEVGQMYRAVAQRGGVGLVLVHHTRKHDKASSEGQSGNMDAGRGASALSGLVRSMFTLFQMNKTEAKKYGIKESDRWAYLHMEGAKGNLTKGGFSKWYKRESFSINVSVEHPDGESVGVIKSVQLILLSNDASSKSGMLSEREQALWDIIEQTIEMTQSTKLSKRDLRRDFYAYLDLESSQYKKKPLKKGSKWEAFKRALQEFHVQGRILLDAGDFIHIHNHPQMPSDDDAPLYPHIHAPPKGGRDGVYGDIADML